MKRKHIYWTLQVLGWTAQAAANLMFVALFAPRQTLARSALIYGLCAVTGIMLSHQWRSYLRRRGWLQLPVSELAGRALLACLFLGALQTFCAAIYFRLLLAPTTFTDLSWLPFALTIWSLTFILWTAFYAIAHYTRQARMAELRRVETELAAKDADLRALLSQVNPHFLFNSLNSLRALIFEDSGRAVQMVDELSGLLRYSLQSERSKLVPLRRELEAVKSYLALEKIRFEERLQIVTEVEEGALDAMLPPMLAQTLVENAVKHGIERLAGGGEIRVSASMDNGLLYLTVENTGSIQEGRSTTRVGLRNATKRLGLLCGEGATLRLTESGGRVCAAVIIPQEVAIASANH